MTRHPLRPLFLPILLLPFVLLVPLAACAAPMADADEGRPATEPPPAGLERATFAGGCFWCMEPPFDRIDGVKSTTSGYIGGEEVRPTYKEVSYGRTGHTEAVEIVYDPEKVSYEELLKVFWHNIDPTVENRQFCDAGTQYRTGIYVHDEEQRRLAEASRQEVVEAFDVPIVTPVVDAGPFYPAEEYHQDFYIKKPRHYERYRQGCGRDARLEELWGDAAGGY